jgi:hypothetical protein
MKFVFITKGRLGNAIFRYMGCAILCIKYNGEYTTITNNINFIINDKIFSEIIKNNLSLQNSNYLLSDFYQHDSIYKKHKAQIIDFINKNDHIVITDGINAGDGNRQEFLMKTIINSPHNFNKTYDMVFHIRLGDMVKLNITISLDKILNLIDNIQYDVYNKIAIVCDKCTSHYEEDFIKIVSIKLNSKFNTTIIFESNDILTDFYIMSNCKILVCSVSTLSWCAAFFSKTIEKCYMPKHTTSITNEYCDCYYPIDNTELYDI